MADKKREGGGFTLVEVVLALALSTLTIGVIYQLYLSQYQKQVVRENILDMQQQARAALDLVSRELKMAGFDPRGVNRDALKGNDFFGIAFDSSELRIKADLDGNGVPTDSHESIVYSHDTDTMTLRRNTGGGRQPVSENIETFSVKYFDREGKFTPHSEDIFQVLSDLEREMEEAAHNLQFERAIQLRDQIKAVQKRLETEKAPR